MYVFIYKVQILYIYIKCTVQYMHYYFLVVHINCKQLRISEF
jgi:hypothetical protein